MTTQITNVTPLVVDVKRRRPGCVNLQAAMGGDGTLLRRLFDSQDWVTDHIDDLRVIFGTEEQWRAFSRELERRRYNPA